MLLTGGRGAGKTTLLGALRPAGATEIVSFAEPKKAVYLRDNLTDKTTRIGCYDENLPGSENKMRPLRDGLCAAAGQIAACPRAEGEWVTVDEIGYLECTCPEYLQALEKLLENKRVMAAVRKQDLPALRQLLHRGDAFVADLDAPFGNTGCVVMASGVGKRFGSNKLMADFRGEPLLCRALDATEGIFARRVVVTRHREILQLCRDKNVECLLHDLPQRSDTVRLGLEALQGVESCLFCPGDQPLLSRDTVAALALCARQEPESIWRTASGERPGAPVLFPGWAFSELLSLPEGAGGGAVIQKHPERVRLLPVRDERELMDADTPEALRLLAEG